jgi:hypothetical protein
VQWLHGVVVSVTRVGYGPHGVVLPLVTRVSCGPHGVVLSHATRVGREPHGVVVSAHVSRVGRGLLPTRMRSCAHDFVAFVSVLMVTLYKERAAVGLLVLISAANLDGTPSCCVPNCSARS